MIRKQLLARGVKDSLQYAAIEETIIDNHYNSLRQYGKEYKKLTTFYGDLSIAEWYGKDSVIDTFNNICANWFSDVKFFTEFVICLNIKAWEHYSHADNNMDDTTESMELSRLYSDLYHKAKDLVYEKWTGDDIDYFFEVTD